MDNRLIYQRGEDKRGRNPVVNQYVYYPDGTLKEAAGGGITYRYEYTENGLLRRKESSGKMLLQYGYDGNRNLTSLTDVTGKTVRYAYDAMNRLERVEDAEQGVVLAGYQYTSFGQVRFQEYGNGVRSKYQYGEGDNLTGIMTPGGFEIRRNYDECDQRDGARCRGRKPRHQLPT